MSKPRKALPKAVEYLLWASSGGICEFDGCEQRLVFEDAGKTVNIADKAHIISHSPEGPRGEEKEKHGMNEEEIDSANNLILLCKNHHKLVDANPEKYTVDVLYNMKRKHEQWVMERLARVKTSIAILHKTKGPPVDKILLADKLNLKVLGLAPFQEDLDNISQIDWITVKKKNIEVYKEAMELLHTYEGTLFNVFPLSQIPLLIHLGNLITDTIPIQVFQYDRNTGNWVLYAPDTKDLEDLGLTYDLKLRNSKTLTVSLAVSSTIHHDDINAMIPIDDCDFLEITIREPGIDKVLYKEDVDSVKNCFKSQVERLQQQHRYDEIHLFYAGPAGLAVELGRAINRKMWPEVHLYHYDYRSRPHYQKAFSI
jgi:hypothetical protein